MTIVRTHVHCPSCDRAGAEAHSLMRVTGSVEATHSEVSADGVEHKATATRTPEADRRQECIEFAKDCDTPNVRRALLLAESGYITWEDCRRIFARAIDTAAFDGLRPEQVL